MCGCTPLALYRYDATAFSFDAKLSSSVNSILRNAIDRSDGARLIVLRMEAGERRESEPHRHARGQLGALNAGLMTIDTAAGRWVMPPGRIGWIPPGFLHAAQLHGTVEGWSAYLAPGDCATLPAEPCVLACSALVAPIMERASQWDEGALQPPQQRLLEVLLDELAVALAQPLQLPFPQERRLVRIARALASEPGDKRSLDEWARWAGLSGRSLSRNFAKETGMPFVQWRQLARMVQALEQLAGGMPVNQVAWSLGYESVSTFIAAFKRLFGATPSQFAVRS